jgi:hypothetical protein
MTLYCKIVVTDASGVEHTILPQGSGGNQVARLSLPYGGSEAKSFWFTVQDIDGAYTSWLAKGNVTRVYCDDASPPMTLRLTGMVEDIVRNQENSASLRLSVSGRDRSYIRMLERIVIEAYTNAVPSSIIRDLLSLYLPYPSDTVLAMSFYEGTGVVSHDESQSKNDGALNGPTWTASGKYGSALVCAALNNHVDLAKTITLSGSFTIMFWAKRTNTARAHTVVSHTSSTCKVGYANGANTAYVRVKTGGAVALPTVSVAGNWEMITVTRNSAHKVDFYLNGDAATRLYSDAAQAGDSVYNLLCTDESNNYFAGNLDELRVWDRCLSAVEVKACYAHGYLHHVAPHVDTALEKIVFNYKPFRDCLDTLATLSSSKYFWAPTEVLRFLEDVTTDSGIAYTDSDLSQEPSATLSLTPIKNRVYLIGGVKHETDQSQTVIGA